MPVHNNTLLFIILGILVGYVATKLIGIPLFNFLESKKGFKPSSATLIVIAVITALAAAVLTVILYSMSNI